MARVPFALLEPETRKPSKVRLTFLLLFVLLLVLSVVFIALYAIERNKANDGTSLRQELNATQISSTSGPPTPVNPSTKGTNSTTSARPPTSAKPTAGASTCSSPACVISAADILNKLDESTNPCDDFYQYSCGGFLEKTHLDDQSSKDSLDVARERSKYSLRDLLQNEKLMSNYSEDPNSAVYKAFTFYKLCMNESVINSAGIKPVLDVIERHGSWNITNENWSGDSWRLEKILARVMTDLQTPAFLAMDVRQSIFNSSEMLILIGAGSSGYDDRLDVTKTKSSQEHYAFANREAYKWFMSTAFKLLGSKSTIDEEVKRIVDLETEFTFDVKRYPKFELPTDPEEIRKKVKIFTLDELNNATSFKFNWTMWLEEMLRGTNRSITSVQKLIIQDPYHVKKIVNWITAKPKGLLANEIMWNVVRSLIFTLPTPFIEVYNKYIESSYGKESVYPRWKICNQLTDKGFTYATTLLYINEHFPEGARKTATELFTEIKGQFIAGLKEQTWMDNATRANARLKLDKMKELVGFPSFIKDPAKLNEFYENIQVWPSRFLESQMNIFRYQAFKKLNEFGRPPDNNRFLTTPLTVNAYYYGQTNGLTIPAGILQPPTYMVDRLRALNYGSLGIIVGHEITHAFDKKGIEYDENGNLRSWWTKKSHENFVKRSTCLIEQYNKVEIDGHKVDGNKTLSENIADNGGIKYAFRAYQNWRETHGNEPKLPALPFNNDQLFFIGLAQLWCTKFKKEQLDTLMKGEHALGPVRVRVSLTNFPEFSKAFGCPLPKNTCAVW